MSECKEGRSERAAETEARDCAFWPWVAAKGRGIFDAEGRCVRVIGTAIDITARKRAEERLQEERRGQELLGKIGHALAGAQLDLERVVQIATDAATELSGAAFGAFFYNVQDEKGEWYTLYTLCGASREAFVRFPQPSNTGVFGPTFRGEGAVRSADITTDPRYGHNAPYRGMYGQAEDQQRAQSAGFDDHLIKPVDLPALERGLGGIPKEAQKCVPLGGRRSPTFLTMPHAID